jgi:hypothetical protein
VSVAGRRRALAAVALVVLAVAGFVIAGHAGGGGQPAIADGAARLVPSDALVYVHLSTDRRRDAVERALKLAGKFPDYPRLRDAILRRLSVSGDAADVGDFLGDEAALALLNSSSGTAGSLVIVAVRDQDAARSFLAEGRGSQAAQHYRGVRMDQYGQVMAGFVGNYVVIGQKASVEQAIDLSKGKGASLATDEQYRRAMAGAPADRFADAYVTGDGVTRLLAPAGGLLGAAGTLLNRPGLHATALSLSADDPGAVLTVHTLGRAGQFKPFTANLLGAVPKGALAYIGVRGFDQAAARLLAATGTQATTLAQVIGAIPRDLIVALQGEVGIVLTTASKATVLTVVAHAGDEAGARRSLQRLAAPLRKVLPNLRVSSTTVAGTPVVVLRSGPRFQLDAAVFDGRLVISTAPAGIAAVRGAKGGLAGEEAFKRVVTETGSKMTAVGFLDFDQLLALAERTGLDASTAYQAIRADLRRVRALGFSSAGSGGNTTAEIRFDIP